MCSKTQQANLWIFHQRNSVCDHAPLLHCEDGSVQTSDFGFTDASFRGSEKHFFLNGRRESSSYSMLIVGAGGRLGQPHTKLSQVFITTISILFNGTIYYDVSEDNVVVHRRVLLLSIVPTRSYVLRCRWGLKMDLHHIFYQNLFCGKML